MSFVDDQIAGARPSALDRVALPRREQYFPSPRDWRDEVIPHHPDHTRALAAASIAAPSFYLLRPDGHIGLWGGQIDEAAIRSWLLDACHLRKPPARDFVSSDSRELGFNHA